MTANRILHLDFECFSDADIKKVGLENYLRSPEFAVTVVAWAFDDGPVLARIWPDVSLPDVIRAHVRTGGEIRAHNASFEWTILKDVYDIYAAPEQMICTMQKALAYGLPGGLLKAGRAINAPILKDESKRRLMLRMARPRKGQQPWHETDPAKLAELAEYCMDDVRAERCLDGLCPDLHPFEQRLAWLDMRINREGMLVDRQAVKVLRAAAAWELMAIDAECSTLTEGDVTRPGTQVGQLMSWLRGKDFELPDVSKETVAGALTAEPPADVRRVLELRQMAAKSSLAKLDRMMDVASTVDDRARNLLQFYGAGRTGRWAGRLIQPQNLPRIPKGFRPEAVIAAAGLDLAAPGLLWGDAMDAISKCLRACFVAKPGHVLVSADLSQIEARVLAWLAGQQDVVDAFRQGLDVYTMQAYKVGSRDRQLGKVLTLACGYGMGARKFRETAAAAPYNLDLAQDEAERHLSAWRRANPEIVRYWRTVEDAVRLSIGRVGMIVNLPATMAVRTRNGVTQVRKPNGVKLSYHDMRLEDGGLVFSGVNGVTKQWGTERTYGGRLVENLVQSVARDVMATGMLNSSYRPVMTVHDEIIWEVPEGQQVLVSFTAAWTPGLPVASEETRGRRYAK